MHLTFRCAACRFGVEDSAGARERRVGKGPPHRRFGVRRRVAHRGLRLRFVCGPGQRRHHQNAGGRAAMRHQQVVFEFQIRRGERQPGDPAFEPAERIVFETRRQTGLQRAVETPLQRVAQRRRTAAFQRRAGPPARADRSGTASTDARSATYRKAALPRVPSGTRRLPDKRRAKLPRCRFRMIRVVARHEKKRALAKRGSERIDGFFPRPDRLRSRQQRQQIGLYRDDGPVKRHTQ